MFVAWCSDSNELLQLGARTCSSVLFYQIFHNQQKELVTCSRVTLSIKEKSFYIIIDAACPTIFEALIKAAVLRPVFKKTKQDRLLISNHSFRAKILSQNDLNQALDLINEFDHLDDITKQHIDKAFQWFMQHSPKLEHRLAHEHKDTIISIRGKPGTEITKKCLEDVNKKLLDALNNANIVGVEEALAAGANPNLKETNFINEIGKREYPVLVTALDCCLTFGYLRTKQQQLAYLNIIDKLLVYGADPYILHPLFGYSALDWCAKLDKNGKLISLFEEHLKKSRYKLDDIEFVPASYKKQFDILKENAIRRNNCYELQLKRRSDIQAVTVLKSKTCFKTHIKRINGENLTVEFCKIADLNYHDAMELDLLYKKHISTLGELPRTGFVDIIRNGQGKMIGFSCLQMFSGCYLQKEYMILYCKAAGFDKEYRGTRLSSLLSFRMAYVLALLKQTHEVYVYYNAIHFNSFRQASGLDQYFPKYRKGLLSVNFVKTVFRNIYGEAKANQFNQNNTFFVPSTSKVLENFPERQYCDQPGLIRQFQHYTQHGKGGVPMMFVAGSSSLGFFAESFKDKLNGFDLKSHVEQLASLISANAYSLRNRLALTNKAACLYPDVQEFSQATNSLELKAKL